MTSPNISGKILRKSQLFQEHGIGGSCPVREGFIRYKLIISEVQQQVKVESVGSHCRTRSLAPSSRSLIPTGSLVPSTRSLAPSSRSLIPTGSLTPSTRNTVPTGGHATSFRGVVGVAFLLDVRRHHQQRLAQIHGFADRLEAGGRGVGVATGHLAQELLVVQIVEGQSLIDHFDRSLVRPVPEKRSGTSGWAACHSRTSCENPAFSM